MEVWYPYTENWPETLEMSINKLWMKTLVTTSSRFVQKEKVAISGSRGVKVLQLWGCKGPSKLWWGGCNYNRGLKNKTGSFWHVYMNQFIFS